MKELFSEEEYTQRIRNLDEKINDIDTFILFNRADTFYYSGIGLDGFIIKENDNYSRYVTRNLDVAKELSTLDIKEMKNFRIFKDIGKNLDIDKIGLELDLVPYNTVRYIVNAMGNPEVIDISNQLRQIRSVKSAKEQEYMKLAAKQTDDSFEYAKEIIKPGMTEKELSAEIGKFLRFQGHPGYVQVRMFHYNYTALSYVMSGESTYALNAKFGPFSGNGSCRYH
ncbi:MAG: aminopeptidase P family N-terminal domain-containing protein, partial [Candidatus Heimdallarchaeota archaeon]|nr:aminopeptidase P family N-terminal domain-containing protein [Candidatus Heimdallarchaeota archaeon]